MFEPESIVGLLYIFGAILLCIAIWTVVDQLRLRRLRRRRQGKGFTSEQFIEAFRPLGMPDNIAATVFDLLRLYQHLEGIFHSLPTMPIHESCTMNLRTSRIRPGIWR